MTIAGLTVKNTGSTNSLTVSTITYTFPVLSVQAPGGTSAATNMALRTATQTGAPSGGYGLFDIVSSGAPAKSVSAAKQFVGTPAAVSRIRFTLVSAHPPTFLLSHSANFTSRTSITPPTPTSSSGGYHYDTGTLGSPITDTYFHLVGTETTAGDTIKVSDFRLYDAGGIELLGPAAPTAPTGLMATAGNAQVTLTWGAATDADTYNVYRGTGAGLEAPAPIATGIAFTSLPYVDSTVSNGTAYYYTVAGVNNGGAQVGPVSSEAGPVTPHLPNPAPGVPTGLHGTGASGQITWAWSANGETYLAGYRLYVGGTKVYDGTSLSYVETGLTNGTSYTGRVSAYNTDGLESAQSPPFTAKAGVSADPLTVSITSPADGSTLQGVIPFRVQADGGVGSVAKVQLYVSGGLVDSKSAVTTAPDFYDLTWDTTPSGNGAYTVYAIATDGSGNQTQSASITITTANPSRPPTEYVISQPFTPNGANGQSIKTALLTCHIVPYTDSRNKRLITAGYDHTGNSQDFSTYTDVLLDHQFYPPAGTTRMRVGFELAALYSYSAFTFAPQVVKLIPYQTAKAKFIIWTTEQKLYLCDGISTPALLLDMNPILLSGETVKDVCWFNGRIYIALAGGTAPLDKRIYAHDLTTADEDYSVATFLLTATPNCLVTDARATTLFIGTSAGQVHTLDTSGNLKILVGKTTPLAAPVSSLIAQTLAPTNTTPGVAIALTDGTLWDIDSSEATHGARLTFTPPDGTTTLVNAGAVQTDAGAGTVSKYLGTSGSGGNLFRLAQGAVAYTLDFSFGFNVLASAAYSNTVYFAGNDTRLWGKILDAGAHTLAYGAVTDALPGVTAIVSMITLANGSLFLGCTGTGNTLIDFSAPTESPLATYGSKIADIGLMCVSLS